MTLPERRNARVLLLDAEYRVWMLRIEDGSKSRWILPGGGLEGSESWEQAARRELWEECAISDAEIGPLLATRFYEHVYNGVPYLSNERYFLVKLNLQLPSAINMFDYELADYTHQGWFSAEDIRSSEEPVYPIGLADLLDEIRLDRVPAEPVIWDE